MSNVPYRQTPLAVRVLLTLLFLTIAGMAQLRIADQQSATQIHQSLQNSLTTFAVARTLNGVISVAQGTELAIEPAGVGISLAVGEVLDPINDLIERFSWVMLASSTSLGIQALVLEFSGAKVIGVLLTLISLLMAGYLWLPAKTGTTPRLLLSRALILLCFIRFSVIAVVLMNHQLSAAFLNNKIVESTEILQQTTARIEKLEARSSQQPVDAQAGFTEQLKTVLKEVAVTFDAKKKLTYYQDLAAKTVSHIIELAALFLVQTILIPLIFFWALIKMLRYLLKIGE